LIPFRLSNRISYQLYFHIRLVDIEHGWTIFRFSPDFAPIPVAHTADKFQRDRGAKSRQMNRPAEKRVQ